jgi:DNA primase
MAEAGSFADKVKQQADIVRVVGEYVRLKKSGQNFTGLCPFHSEKTPSFAVHPVKQIYHCFGCGVGGDVFQFVMEMEKCSFPDAVRTVAEKCGIAVPRPRERSPEERQENQQRTALVEIHREAQAFFARQLETTPEGKAARAYLEDRGLDAQAVTRFGLGYAPSGGDALLRALRAKYAEKLLSLSGLVSGDGSGRLYDRFRRRIIFPIANESGKVIAFGGRALGDDQPKYLNSPETPIYSKSAVLYNLHTAKEPIRREGFAIVVEGYMDAIALVRAGFLNVVATCGTSFAEGQAGLLKKVFGTSVIPRLVLSYDPDFAGSAAADRAMPFLQERYGTDLSGNFTDSDVNSKRALEFGFELRLLQLPPGEDPDNFIRKHGVAEYRKLLASAPTYLDFLIGRAKEMDLATGEGKLQAVNFLLPYLQRIPNKLLRSEWAGLIAMHLRVEEPVLREAIKRAASERRDKVTTNPVLVAHPGKQVERRLIQLLFEAEGFRRQLAQAIRTEELHRGLETERILEALLAAILVAGGSGERPDAVALGAALEDRDKRLLFEIAFESGQESTWEEAESCLGTLRRLRFETELAQIQAEIEIQAKSKSAESAEALRQLLERKQELSRRRSGAAH